MKPGVCVDIVMKEDQRSSELMRGYVRDILTNSPQHPHGINVRLELGEVCRVKQIIDKEE